MSNGTPMPTFAGRPDDVLDAEPASRLEDVVGRHHVEPELVAVRQHARVRDAGEVNDDVERLGFGVGVGVLPGGRQGVERLAEVSQVGDHRQLVRIGRGVAVDDEDLVALGLQVRHEDLADLAMASGHGDALAVFSHVSSSIVSGCRRPPC